MMIKILFICHGNICRSPMAQCIFSYLVEKRGLSDQFVIDSCAISTEEIGNPIYRPAKEMLQKKGIPIIPHRAVQLKKSDYERYDYLIAMDNLNLRNISYIINSDPGRKIHRLLDFTSKGGNVDDPWYSDRFDIAYDDIYTGCTALLDMLTRR